PSLYLTSSHFHSSATRPPPLYTLFPYTTLFRSLVNDLISLVKQFSPESTTFFELLNWVQRNNLHKNADLNKLYQAYLQAMIEGRSEEHTSELQSRFDLVCRLLLEKKKKIQTRGI